MKILLFIVLVCLCPNAFADFNNGNVFGRGIVVQANGVTQTGGGRTLNFASGTTVTVNNNAYQITASGGSSGGTGSPGGSQHDIQFYDVQGTVTSFGGNGGLVYTGTGSTVGNVGIGSVTPGSQLDIQGTARVFGAVTINL